MIADEKLTIEKSSSYIQTLNEAVKRSEEIIIIKSCCLQIAANLSDKSIKISLKVRLDFLINFDETEVYFAEFKAAKLAHIDQNNLLL